MSEKVQIYLTNLIVPTTQKSTTVSAGAIPVVLASDHEALLARFEALEENLVAAYRQSRPPNDGACLRCAPSSPVVKPGFACWWHQGQDILARRGREALKGDGE